MKTKLFSIENIDEAGEMIRQGGLVAFPTETVYGLGASAYDAAAAEKIYKAKGRPSDNPLIVHVSSKAQIEALAAEIPPMANIIIDKFMPGPLTLIFKKKNTIPDTVTAGLDTVAIRFPSHKTALALINAAGVPIAAPSANLSGKPSPTQAKHVIEDMNGRVDAIIDGGDCQVGVESTIIDVTGDEAVILRPGGITLDDLEKCGIKASLDKNVLSSLDKNEIPKCPGMKYKHYAPEADVVVVEGEKDAVCAKIKEIISENRDSKIGVLKMYDNEYGNIEYILAGNSNADYARHLFSALRQFDEMGVELIIAEFCEKDGYGLAVKNRLYKAAAQNVIHV